MSGPHPPPTNPNFNNLQGVTSTIYITNFPPSTGSKDLWNHCSKHGTFVDVYIARKLSKVGRKFAFVRFLKIKNNESLVNDLNKIWIGSYHLYAAMAKFEKNHNTTTKSIPISSFTKTNDPSKQVPHSTYTNPNQSYVNVLNGNGSSNTVPKPSKPTNILKSVTLDVSDLINTSEESSSFSEPPGFKAYFSNSNCFPLRGNRRSPKQPSHFSSASVKSSRVSKSQTKSFGNHGSMIEASVSHIEMGKVLGYDMEGSKNDLKKFIDSLDVKQGNSQFEFVELPASGRSGGLSSIWDPNAFSKVNEFQFERLLVVEGIWIASQTQCFMINVYALQDDSKKEKLWNDILDFMNMNRGHHLIFRDFNVDNPIVSFKNKMKTLKAVIKEWNLKRKGPVSYEMDDLIKKIKDFDSNIVSQNADFPLILIGLPGLTDYGLSISTRTLMLLRRRKSNRTSRLMKIPNFSTLLLTKNASIFLSKGLKLMGFGSMTPLNTLLTSPILETDIKDAIWDCGSDKSPGPDGFTFAFYKEFWNVVKKDILAFVGYFFTTGIIPRGCNTSFIALTPKVPCHMMINDFRPISLIGAQYKIIAKVLANRLARVIDSIISPEQLAFIKQRQILNGPLMVNEVIQLCKCKKSKLMVFKIDFEMAFDTISWDFLFQVMHFMGFNETWFKWISGCLHSASASILINGCPTYEFNILCSLRQGDPLSPFLFIIVLEGLHVAMEDTMAAGLYNGCKINTVNLSHLFFTDDALFIGEWSRSNIYLGLPIDCNMALVKSWDPIIGKFSKRLTKWKASLLSIGGRTTLTSSVLGAL
nr:RNA-directed DNA polymerase, eukaryota, reverse transcriptase zinc-binding domain protein [Tanacetum cinerariifolium]